MSHNDNNNTACKQLSTARNAVRSFSLSWTCTPAWKMPVHTNAPIKQRHCQMSVFAVTKPSSCSRTNTHTHDTHIQCLGKSSVFNLCVLYSFLKIHSNVSLICGYDCVWIFCKLNVKDRTYTWCNARNNVPFLCVTVNLFWGRVHLFKNEEKSTR